MRRKFKEHFKPVTGSVGDYGAPARIIKSFAQRGLARALFAVPLFLASSCLLAQSASSAPIVVSPNGRLQMRFAILRDGKPTDSSGTLVYSVQYGGNSLVNDSGLSLKLEGQPPLGANVQIAKTVPGSGVDDYAPIAGKTAHVHDAYNSTVLTLMEPDTPGRTFMVEARAYDGGVAFRYVVPQQAALTSFRLEQEHTQFSIGKDAPTWALYLPNFRSAYESEYLHLNVSAFANQGGTHNQFLIGLPLLMHVPGVAWMAIMEAGLEGDAKMYLTDPSDPAVPGSLTRVESVLSPQWDNPRLAVVDTLPHHSAWHVLLVGDEPGRLIESNVIDDLNPPTAIADTAWIKPGKTAWNWWSGNIGPDGKPANTTATMKYYVDFAAQSGFPYMLIDAGWSLNKGNPAGRGATADITKMAGNVDVPAVVRYAASKGVKVWIWINYKPAAAQMDTAFPLYEKWGVAGVKIDFVQRDDQDGIAFYYRAARVAAEHHLLVDFHGATTPWGLERTYPNVVGHEAVMGMEYSKWSARDNPIHRTTLPFTRMLAGPMDYTPGGFRNATEAQFVARNLYPMVLGTRAQQLALYVVDFVPSQMVSDAPSAYANQPAFQFIRDVPTTWDETRVLQGFPAEDITIARRKGRNWYLGSITNWTARDLSLPLNFLGNGQYTAEIYRDADDAKQNPQHVSIEKKSVQQNDTLPLHLASGGGCAIEFIRTK